MKYQLLVLFAGSVMAVNGCGGDTAGGPGGRQCVPENEVSAATNAVSQFNKQALDAAVAAAGYQYTPSANQKKLHLEAGAMKAVYVPAETQVSFDELRAASTPTPNANWPHYTTGTIYQVTLAGVMGTYVAGSAGAGTDVFLTKNMTQQTSRMVIKANVISQESINACDRFCELAIALLPTQNLYAVDADYQGDVNISYDQKLLTVNRPLECQ